MENICILFIEEGEINIKLLKWTSILLQLVNGIICTISQNYTSKNGFLPMVSQGSKYFSHLKLQEITIQTFIDFEFGK